MHSVTNSSGRSINVERTVVEPEGTERLVQIFGADDDLYAFGDSLDFAVMSRLSIRPRKLTIYWRFEDEPESDENGFIIPL